MSFFDASQIKKGYAHLLKSNQRSILLAVSRCLVPDRQNMRVVLDDRRFADELKLMKYYTNIKENRSLLSCIAPIAFTNNDVNEIMVQSLKAFKILTGIEADIMQRISLFVVINDMKDADMKQALISYDIDTQDKSSIIEFQKTKIKAIISLDKKDYKSEMLKNLYDNDQVLQNDLMILQELKSVMSPDTAFNDEDLNVLERKMTDYIMDIRNFKINRNLYNEQVNPLDLIKYDINENIYIPILGNISILGKELDGKILKMKIEARSGTYDFKFIKN